MSTCVEAWEELIVEDTQIVTLTSRYFETLFVALSINF